MNKRECLAFLQSCIDRINIATDDEIAAFQKSYALNCIDFMEPANFQFIPPTGSDSYLYEKNEVKEITISESECVEESNTAKWKYNIKGINEQSDENLPYAA